MVYKDIWKNTDERGYVKWKKKNVELVKSKLFLRATAFSCMDDLACIDRGIKCLKK